MKFLVGYNGTKEAKEALKVALAHAKIWNANLEVVNTITREVPLKHSFVQETEKKLESEVEGILGKDNVPFEIQLLLTSLTSGEHLVKFAEDQKVDRIFLGIPKKSRVSEYFGSTAQYVILHAPCPVVTV